jgi:hypothetical protein
MFINIRIDFIVSQVVFFAILGCFRPLISELACYIMLQNIARSCFITCWQLYGFTMLYG